MPVFETESLVLKSYNLAEADRIVLFFTREHGMVRGVAKGAKRLKSRFGSSLEPFSVVNLEYFQKEDRELVSIQRVDLLRSCFDRASDPAFLNTFSYVADLLATIVPPHDPNETLYRMVIACLDAAENPNVDLAGIRLYFELWLMRLSGYLPQWSLCAGCRRVLEEDEVVYLKSDFHLLCSSCNRSRSSQSVDQLQRQIFERAQKLSPSAFADFAYGKSTAVLEVSNILKRIISTVTGKEVATEKSFAVNF
jgi:DNA repair protein RecO (recombination protein O)